MKALHALAATVCAALVLAGLAPFAQADSSQTLFTIQRSTNKNEVHYDARLDAGGKLDASEPVEVYWLMLAENGQREGLNWIERRKAYGFSIEATPGGESYQMRLRAEEDRPITVLMEGTKARAETVIDGRAAILERIFIASTPGGFIPRVEYVELFGTDSKSGEQRTERIGP